jgi:hypothetical protein
MVIVLRRMLNEGKVHPRLSRLPLMRNRLETASLEGRT